MTKLVQWLLGLSIFVTIWATLLSERLLQSTSSYKLHIWLLPVYACLAFGCGRSLFCISKVAANYSDEKVRSNRQKVYAASVVLHRVFTFNNCEAAAVELKKQIVEAREDLQKRGYKFDSWPL